MNYHDKRNKARSKLGIRSDWAVNKPGSKIVGNPISYGRLPGNGTESFVSQSELYLVTTCFCYWCRKHLASMGLEPEIETDEPFSMVVELTSDERLLEYDFKPRGSHQWHRRSGIFKILRALQADVKGPWTKKPFMFLGRLVRPGHWNIEKFDHLNGTEVALAKPVNAKTVQTDKSPFDDKLDFESRAQMNREFEKKFE